jgi:hypothetical protein
MLPVSMGRTRTIGTLNTYKPSRFTRLGRGERDTLLKNLRKMSNLRAPSGHSPPPPWPGVLFALIDKTPFGAAVNKGLTIKTGQTHVQRYGKSLLEKIQAVRVIHHLSSLVVFLWRKRQLLTRPSVTSQMDALSCGAQHSATGKKRPLFGSAMTSNRERGRGRLGSDAKHILLN